MRTIPPLSWGLAPRSRRSLFSAFIQDEIKLANSVSLTLGSKFEHNALTGFEYEPSAQLVWTPSSRHTLWASAARAIRSWLKLRNNLDWDSTLMYVSPLSNLAIPSYVRLDTRLGWTLGEFVELSIVGHNLLRARHMEFSDRRIRQTEAERSVLGRVTWRF